MARIRPGMKTAAQLATDPALRAAFGSPMQRRVARLLARAATDDHAPFSTLTADPPTITVGTAATLSGRVLGAQGAEVTEVGSRGVWSSTFSRLPALGVAGLDFFHTGTAVEIHFRPGTTQTLPIWVFVDGKPVTATEDSTTVGAVTVSVETYVKLTWAQAKRRRIEFFAPHLGDWRTVRVATGDSVMPAPRRPVVAWVGDSFYAGSGGASALSSSAFLTSRALGVECYTAAIAYGGTGYSTPGTSNTFGAAARVASAVLAAPDLIVFQGSTNDDGKATIQADAAAAYAAYAASLPDVPMIVLGAPPTNAATTTTANRSANIAAVKAAALAASNVIGFHDMIGTATGVPIGWSGATSYPDGSLVVRQGSVWKLVNGGTAVTGGPGPELDNRWQLTTWGFWGSGQVGATTGVGNRDTLSYSDNTHATAEGHRVLAAYTAQALRDDLSAFVAGGAVTVT